jgi:asparagine synthase (glutamine-hydrolysing)
MCGIAGWFGPNCGWDAEVFRNALQRRGPDGSGVWQSENATLVHTRLAILDLSDAGKQPMEWPAAGVGASAVSPGNNVRTSESSRLAKTSTSKAVLCFNGEIYNHNELRETLTLSGDQFLGHSDTEVLLRLLVREQESAIPMLAGMFAFAFWDAESGEALLVRDAYGIKPLYYRLDGNSLAFASEFRVLSRDTDSVDAATLRDFFLWGSVQEPQTLLSQVRQLPAGHVLHWHQGKVIVRQWYRPQFTKTSEKPTSRCHSSEAVHRTRVALEESVKRHLVSDVPIGIFLSGGIDSTAVLALARKVLGKSSDLRTFSIGFEDPLYDESSLARRTAEHFGAQHTEWRMKPEEGAAEIPAYLSAVDQPSIDGFNTWCVSKLARQESIKVVLSGLGGDEWFAGYGSFGRVPRFRSFYRLLGPLRPIAARCFDASTPGSPWRRLAAFLRGGGSWLSAFHVQRGIFTPEESRLLAEKIGCSIPGPTSWESGPLPDEPRAIAGWLEVTRYMRNQLLRDSDVFSMAHGLELRVPFVDVRLATTLLELPSEIRLQQGKKLLLDAVPEVPDWVRRQPKRGFRFPFQEWMEGQFGETLAEARNLSPVPLRAWYRTWAVAAAVRCISPYVRHDRGDE